MKGEDCHAFGGWGWRKICVRRDCVMVGIWLIGVMKTFLYLSRLVWVLVWGTAWGWGSGVKGGAQNGLGPGGCLPKLNAVAPVVVVDPAIKADAKVTLTGKLRGGMMAIGGETTGWTLAYGVGGGVARIEVDVRGVEGWKTEEETEVTVSGVIVVKQYVERGSVFILKATSVVKAGGGAGKS